MKQSYLQSVVVASVTAAVVGAIMLIGFMFFSPKPATEFAVLNLGQVLTESKVGKMLGEYGKKSSEELNEEAQLSIQYLNETKQQLEGRKNYISDSEYSEQLQEIEKKQNAIVAHHQKEQERYNAEFNKHRNEIVSKIVKITKRLRSDLEYDHVLLSQSLAAHDTDAEKDDITGEAIKRLNEEMPEVDFDFTFEKLDLEAITDEE